MIDSAVLVRCGHASVVRREDDDGVLFQSEFLQLRSNASQAFIGCFEHPGKLHIILLLFHPPDTGVLMGLQFVILRQRFKFFFREWRPVRIGFENEVRSFLFWHRRNLLAIFVDQIRAPLDRVVYCEVFEMDEEGPVLVALDEIQCRIGQFVRVVVAFFCRELVIVGAAKRIVIGTHPNSRVCR